MFKFSKLTILLQKEDFLQLLLEARAEDIEDLPPSSKKTLSDEEIVSLSIGFILAGYETTSNCLAFTAYLLAINPDKQDILLQAIEDYLQENEVSSYVFTHNSFIMKYVPICIKRIVPGCKFIN